MITLVIGIILALIFGKLIFSSIKIVFKIALNIIAGLVTLFFFNSVFAGFGLGVIVNPFTSFLVGFFGFPAVIALVIFKFIA